MGSCKSGGKRFKSGSERIKYIKDLQKQVSSAKKVESRFYKDYQLASGAYNYRGNNLSDGQIKNLKDNMTKSYHKYINAKDKREKLEKEINKYKSKQTTF